MTREWAHKAHSECGDRVLSAWFDDARFRGAWTPEPPLFASDAQKAIATIAAARGAQLDVDSLVMALKRSSKLHLWENPEDVYSHVQAPAVLDPWAELAALRNHAGKRDLRSSLTVALLELDNGADLDDVRAKVSDAAKAANAAAGLKVRSVKDVLGTAYTKAKAVAKGPKAGQRTLSKFLDDSTGGLRPGVVWVLAAGTSWGKSSAICAMADQCVADGKRPMIISFEDPEVLYGRRLMQIRAGVGSVRLREGKLNENEHSLIAAAYENAEDAPFFLNAIGRPVEAVAADIRSAVKSDGITHVFIDYIQRARVKSKQQDRRLDIFYAGCVLTDAIKEVDVSGLIGSQLTEDEKTGKLKARDCEDLHNNAEVLIFGRKDAVEGQLEMNGQIATAKKISRWMWVQKNKDGPPEFRVDLEWDEHAACFRSEYSSPIQRMISNAQHDDHYDEAGGY